MTKELGEGWAYPHVRRVLALAEQIGSGLSYDPQALQVAACLHDWGAFPRYRQPGVDHALRSRQVAEAEILPHMDLSPGAVAAILEAIELHDYRDPRPPRSAEARLLREADALDLLGVTGIAREFASGSNDLEKCYGRILSRRDGIRGRFTLPAAQAIAEKRLEAMDRFLALLIEETSGCL